MSWSTDPLGFNNLKCREVFCRTCGEEVGGEQVCCCLVPHKAIIAPPKNIRGWSRMVSFLAMASFLNIFSKGHGELKVNGLGFSLPTLVQSG